LTPPPLPIAAVPQSIALLPLLPIAITLPSSTPFASTSGRHYPSLTPTFMAIAALHSAIMLL
jgi:hypothetical protein